MPLQRALGDFEPSDFCIEWNAENQLTRVCLNISPCDSDAVALASFKYDPLGRRVEKVAGGLTYSYVYDGIDILQETTSDGATTTTYRYIHGPGIDESLAREDVATGALTYYHADGLGSINKMTDQAGNVVHSYQYDAWGNIEVGASQGGYAFTGREWVPEIGLYYYRARYYDPEAGRFTSEDPVGFAGGINPYVYVANMPATAVDPMGLQLALSPEVQERMFGPPPGPNATASDRLLYKLNAQIAIMSSLFPVGMATGPAAASRAGHHVFPRHFREFFEQAGINIDDHLVSVMKEWHQQWIHAGKGFGRGGRWLKAWEDFIGKNPFATADEIWDELLRIIDDVGFCGPS